MRIDNVALDDAVTRVGDRWSLRLIAALLDGDKTFSELTSEVGGIAPNILTARLRSLEREALLHSRPYQQRPIRMRYSLTAPGQRLGDAVRLLAEWGAGRGRDASAPKHEICGTTLELRPWCRTCEITVEVADSDDAIWI